MGIYSSMTSDPTGNNGMQLAKYNTYIDNIDKVCELNCHDLSKDETVLLKKFFKTRFLNDEELMEYMNINSKSCLSIRKHSCYIKIAMWFDLEVLK